MPVNVNSTPANGWSVCPKDTPGTVWLYINAAWTSIAAAGSTATNRKAMVVRYEQPNGTDGGAVTTGSRQTYPIKYLHVTHRPPYFSSLVACCLSFDIGMAFACP